MAAEGNPPPHPRFIKKEVTYDLVPYIEDEVYEYRNIKQEPPVVIEDNMEEIQEISIKEECFSSEEYLTVDEYDRPNENNDCTEENVEKHSIGASNFNSSTPVAITKPGMKKKRTVSWRNAMKRGKNSLTDESGKALGDGSYFPKVKHFNSGTLPVNFNGTMFKDGVEKGVGVGEKISGGNSKSENIADANEHTKNSALKMVKDSQSQVVPKYVCHICGKSYSNISNLNRHKAVHFYKLHKCKFCGKSFAQIRALREHKLQHTIKEGQLHNVPKSSFTSQIKPSGKSSTLVKLQKKIISKKQKLEPHTSKLHAKFPKHTLKATLGGRQTFTCNICSKSFSWHYLLRRHKQTHLTKRNIKKEDKVVVESKYSCITCQKTFSSKSHLIRHEGTESHKAQLILIESELKDAEKAKPSCDTCSKTFSCPQNLRKHKKSLAHKIEEERSKEMSDEQYSCDTCGKNFASLQLLKKHEIRHFKVPNIKEEKMKGIFFTCKVCKVSFCWMSEVRKHLVSTLHVSNVNHMKNVKHAENKEGHSCKVCGKIFSKLQILRKHQHNCGCKPQEQNFACHVCGFTFLGEVNLRRHQAMTGHFSESSHESQKNSAVHSCDACGKAFRWSYQLNNHKLVHIAKKYCCNMCGKYFAAEYLLKKHKIVHTKRLTNEKLPHVKVTVCTCNICGEKFAQLSRLQRHKAVCHHLTGTYSENKNSVSDAKSICNGEEKKALSCDLLEADVLPTAAIVGKKTNVKMDYACIVCKKYFTRLYDLQRHKTTTAHIQASKQENGKTNISGFSCDVCGKTLARFSDLSRHKAMAGHYSQTYQNKHIKSENFNNITESKYLLQGLGESHKFTETTVTVEKGKQNENTKAYPCTTCNKRFGRLSDLGRHRNKSGHSLQAADPVEKKPKKEPQEQYSCGTCSKSFSRQNDLRRHVAVTGHAYEAITDKVNPHKNNKSASSSNTRALSLNTQQQFARNMPVAFNAQKVELNVASKSHPCHTCGKKFPWQYQLNNHKCYGATKKYSCKICDKQFSQEYLLKRHKLLHASHSDKMKMGHLKHGSQGTYSCTSCGRIYSRLSDLSRHANISGHVADKSEPKFYCQFCNKFFWRLCDLKRHENKFGHHSYAPNVQEKLNHPTNKPRVKISKPNKVIKHGSTTRHMSNISVEEQKTNSKNKHQCNVCKRNYSWRSGLKRHKLKAGHM